jgi:hypothetical protein
MQISGPSIPGFLTPRPPVVQQPGPAQPFYQPVAPSSDPLYNLRVFLANVWQGLLKLLSGST